MMNKKIMFLPALALSMIFSHSTFADEDMLKDKQCPCIKIQKMKQELNLTPEQHDKIKAFKEKLKDDKKAKKEQLMSINKQVRELVKEDKLDEAKLDQLINQKTEIMASMMKNNIKLKHEIYGVLDSKQKKQFSAIMEQWEKKHMKKMDMMRHDVNNDDDDDDDDEY